MHERIKKWMELELLKPSELAQKLNVNRATISHILSGRNLPSIDFLQKLLQIYPEINMNWLISGVGFIKNSDCIIQKQAIKSIGKIVVFYDDQSFEELKA